MQGKDAHEYKKSSGALWANMKKAMLSRAVAKKHSKVAKKHSNIFIILLLVTYYQADPYY